MSEKEPIKIKLSTVLIIVLIVIVLIMGYYIYDLSQENNTIAKDLEKNRNTVLEPQSEIKEPAVENENKKEDSENAFEVYQENYEKSFNEKINGYNRIETELLNIPGVLQVGIDASNNAYLLVQQNSNLYAKNSEATLKLHEDYSAEIKVDENVANVYVCPVGNGGVVDIILLKKDGTASKIDFDKLVHKDTIECNEIPDIKDAINVIVYADLGGGLLFKITFSRDSK